MRLWGGGVSNKVFFHIRPKHCYWSRPPQISQVKASIVYYCLWPLLSIAAHTCTFTGHMTCTKKNKRTTWRRKRLHGDTVYSVDEIGSDPALKGAERGEESGRGNRYRCRLSVLNRNARWHRATFAGSGLPLLQWNSGQAEREGIERSTWRMMHSPADGKAKISSYLMFFS